MQALQLLGILASCWLDAETNAASPILMAEGAALLQYIAQMSQEFQSNAFDSECHRQLLLELIIHVADGGMGERLDEDSCAGAALAGKMLLAAVDEHLEECTSVSISLASGQLAILAAEAADSSTIQESALIFHGSLSYMKAAKFAGIESWIKYVRVLRCLADRLLCNVHAEDRIHEQVACLGIPAQGVSIDDLKPLWWILQLNPKVIGVNVQTVDCALSRRLIKMCGKCGLIERLSQICLGTAGMTHDVACKGRHVWRGLDRRSDS